MDVDLRVEGAEQLEALARRLKEIGGKDLRRALLRGIERAVKPVKAAALVSARESLPRKGGLNERVAKSRLSTKRRLSGQDVSVRLVASGGDLRRLDEGRVRHPVFGHRKVWVTQEVQPGWFSRPAEAAAPLVRQELLAVFDDVREQIRGR